MRKRTLRPTSTTCVLFTNPTTTDPCFTASCAYSTWNIRPCGELHGILLELIVNRKVVGVGLVLTRWRHRYRSCFWTSRKKETKLSQKYRFSKNEISQSDKEGKRESTTEKGTRKRRWGKLSQAVEGDAVWSIELSLPEATTPSDLQRRRQRHSFRSSPSSSLFSPSIPVNGVVIPQLLL